MVLFTLSGRKIYVCRCPLCRWERDEWRQRLRASRPHPDDTDHWISETLNSIDKGSPEAAQAKLLAELRLQKSVALDLIADMIDPAGQSYWRLQLKRRRGASNRWSTFARRYAVGMFRDRVEWLTRQGRPSPVKTATAEIADELDISEHQLRAIVKRWKE